MTHTIPAHALIDSDEASATQWDVVIVGGGMGGANAAHVLANAGFHVLLIEKGLANFDASHSVGVDAEQHDPEARLASGMWPTRLSTRIDGKDSAIWSPLGCGIGGSTLLYAAALQRLQTIDFEPQTAPDGRELQWPISYSELQPYYQRAEKRFGVCGTEDPLDPAADHALLQPPAMCENDAHLFEEFELAGLHPYRMHVAMKYVPDCGECGGRICSAMCKQDAFNSCVSPAVDTGNLRVLQRTEVARFNATREKVTEAVVLGPGDARVTVRGNVFVLSAGSYFSPMLLLKSTNEFWPNGLANGSGQVGRNLMFHASDFIACWQKGKYSRNGPAKTIALRDFYSADGQKMGEFQSTGLTAGFGSVLYALRLIFDQSWLRRIGFLRHFLRIPAWLASKLYGEATLFATIVEDFPYAENRIVLDDDTPSGIRIEYRITEELRKRVLDMRQRLRKKMPRLRLLPMNVGITLNYGHPCGTIVAGSDPATSVLDRNCKAHELSNLYVVDSSFMPTSGGTNPSLTIAANAERVAEEIAVQLRTIIP